MIVEDPMELTQVFKDEKKLILLFSEDTLARNPIQLRYDGNKSGTLALIDEFGNKVIPFSVLIEVEEEVDDVPAEIPEEPVEEVETPEEIEDPILEEEPIEESPEEGVSEEGQVEENKQLVDETVE